jgi:hypothetical protein
MRRRAFAPDRCAVHQDQVIPALFALGLRVGFGDAQHGLAGVSVGPTGANTLVGVNAFRKE